MPECTNHHFACACREEMFRKLYVATNDMLARLGADGEVTPLTFEVLNLMEVMSHMDDGVFDFKKFCELPTTKGA